MLRNITMRKLVRLSVLASVSAAAVGGLASPGHAAQTSTVRILQGALIYTGTSGFNDVLVFQSGGKIHVSDATPITPGPGCTSVSTKIVTCTSPSVVLGTLGAGNDRFSTTVALGGGVSGQDGDDLFLGGRASGTSRLTYDGGNGFDTVSYALSTAAVKVSLNGLSDDGRSGDQDRVAVDAIIGSSYGDVLTGNDNNNTLNGGRGRDTLNGGGGADLLLANDGSADASLNCGQGSDTARVDATDPFGHNCETVVR
ncbi:hypothetical protein [Streptomyces sp. NPDC096153]|uniref:calcium-binding protein n=1 Tax=Streptomyces sp. NPDC096153 TaxID=3155548 RepID=UPI003316D16C